MWTTVVGDLSRGGDHLISTTHPAPNPFDGRMRVAILVWQKVKYRTDDQGDSEVVALQEHSASRRRDSHRGTCG
jgi:hypothetical protein